MTEGHIALKDIERRAYRSTFADGIYDIQFGLIFLVFALIAIFETTTISRLVGYGLLLIPLILPWLGKRYITVPRMGSVEFGERRKKRRLIILVVATIVLFLTLPLFIMMFRQTMSGEMGWKLAAIFIAPLFVLAVYTTAFPRLYIYTGLLFACSVEAEVLFEYIGSPAHALLSFGIPGLVIAGIGVYMLASFMKTHPRSEVEYAE